MGGRLRRGPVPAVIAALLAVALAASACGADRDDSLAPLPASEPSAGVVDDVAPGRRAAAASSQAALAVEQPPIVDSGSVRTAPALAGATGAAATAAAAPPGRSVPVRSGRIEEVLAADRAERQPPPARLRLPSIGVDAPIVPVEVTRDGELEIPGVAEVGWYGYGPRPGQAGSAVLAGHVDFDGREGVFFELSRLEPGALVLVDDATGITSAFEVVEVVSYDKAELPTAALFDRSGAPALALITCGGEFDRAERSYRDNVVAVARPVPVPAPAP